MRTVVGALCNDVDDFAPCSEEAFLADAYAAGQTRASPGAVSDALDLVADDAREACVADATVASTGAGTVAAAVAWAKCLIACTTFPTVIAETYSPSGTDAMAIAKVQFLACDNLFTVTPAESPTAVNSVAFPLNISLRVRGCILDVDGNTKYEENGFRRH